MHTKCGFSDLQPQFALAENDSSLLEHLVHYSDSCINQIYVAFLKLHLGVDIAISILHQEMMNLHFDCLESRLGHIFDKLPTRVAILIM